MTNASATPAPTTAPASDTDEKQDIAGATKATLDLFAKSKKPGVNALLSGTSAREAVGLAYLGARGDTKRELARAFGLGDGAAFVAARKAEAAGWNAARGKGAELVVANRVWTDNTIHPKASYQTAVLDLAQGKEPPFAAVDFKGASNQARKTINGWVSDKTATKIPELLPEGAVDARTRAVITNAIYFRGRWVFPFPEPATKEAPFFLDGKKTVNAPLMHLTDSMHYGEAPGVKLVELRYLDSEMAFLVAVPDDKDGLAKIEDALTPATLEAWTAALAPSRVDLTLPKFTFRAGGSLKPALGALGVKTTFTDSADFGDMVEDKLAVSDVIQQTYIALDEKGTEAAAATAIVMRATAAMMGKPKEVRADHPFLFFIRDFKRGRILFVGHLANPKG